MLENIAVIKERLEMFSLAFLILEVRLVVVEAGLKENGE